MNVPTMCPHGVLMQGGILVGICDKRRPVFRVARVRSYLSEVFQQAVIDEVIQRYIDLYPQDTDVDIAQLIMTRVQPY